MATVLTDADVLMLRSDSDCLRRYGLGRHESQTFNNTDKETDSVDMTVRRRPENWLGMRIACGLWLS